MQVSIKACTPCKFFIYLFTEYIHSRNIYKYKVNPISTGLFGAPLELEGGDWGGFRPRPPPPFPLPNFWTIYANAMKLDTVILLDKLNK